MGLHCFYRLRPSAKVLGFGVALGFCKGLYRGSVGFLYRWCVGSGLKTGLGSIRGSLSKLA